MFWLHAARLCLPFAGCCSLFVAGRCTVSINPPRRAVRDCLKTCLSSAAQRQLKKNTATLPFWGLRGFAEDWLLTFVGWLSGSAAVWAKQGLSHVLLCVCTCVGACVREQCGT